MTQGSKIPRFVLAERIAHWLYVVLFVGAFVTGVLMWIPATRVALGGARRAFEHYHGAIGLLLIVLPLLIILIMDRRRLAANIREVDRWDHDDKRWFWAALRGGTFCGKEMPPQGRLNAGQKLSTVVVAVIALLLLVTGSLLMDRANLPAWLVSRALSMHQVLVGIAILVLIIHLSHVLVTKHGRKYLNGMISGSLAEDTARERHYKWWLEAQQEEDKPPQ